jgi:hypothetical protein
MNYSPSALRVGTLDTSLLRTNNDDDFFALSDGNSQSLLTTTDDGIASFLASRISFASNTLGNS